MNTFKEYMVLTEQNPPAAGSAPASGGASPSPPAGGPSASPMGGPDLGGLGGLGGGLGSPMPAGGMGGPPSLSGGPMGGLGSPDASMSPQSNIKIQKIKSKNVWDVLDKILSPDTDGQKTNIDYNKISDL